MAPLRKRLIPASSFQSFGPMLQAPVRLPEVRFGCSPPTSDNRQIISLGLSPRKVTPAHRQLRPVKPEKLHTVAFTQHNPRGIVKIKFTSVLFVAIRGGRGRLNCPSHSID